MNYSTFINEFKIENWNNFLLVCDEFLEIILDMISKQDFEQSIPEDVKKVACYKLKGEAASWFLHELPILDGKRPIDLLKSREGLTIVKELLLRMPC